jgi:ribosomal subunit interface protein
MKTTISGKQMKIGHGLREHIEESLAAGIKKYFENAISADVHLSKEAHLFVTDIIVNDGTGTQYPYKSQAKEENVFASFDKALDRMEKQLRRYKRRIKDHQKISMAEASAFAATKYVISDDGQDFEDENGTENSPLIIAEKQMQIEVLTVADAVMRMNLSNLPALMFVNKKTGNHNVVYKRLDGNISWIESTKTSASSSNTPRLKAV